MSEYWVWKPQDFFDAMATVKKGDVIKVMCSYLHSAAPAPEPPKDDPRCSCCRWSEGSVSPFCVVHGTAAAPAPEPCAHEFVSAANKIIENGYVCPKCGALSLDGTITAPDASAGVPDDVRFVINCLEAGQTPDDRKAAAIVASLSRELAAARAGVTQQYSAYLAEMERARAATAELARARELLQRSGKGLRLLDTSWLKLCAEIDAFLAGKA